MKYKCKLTFLLYTCMHLQITRNKNYTLPKRGSALNSKLFAERFICCICYWFSWKLLFKLSITFELTSYGHIITIWLVFSFNMKLYVCSYILNSSSIIKFLLVTHNDLFLTLDLAIRFVYTRNLFFSLLFASASHVLYLIIWWMKVQYYNICFCSI